MRITAKLAYNQIKINRQRTIWTLTGILLSTALITAVCSFIASGNALLVNIYGKNYGEQGGAQFTLLLVPAAIIGILIIAMAVVVISNAFRVSANECRTQFGILKSVGTTKQQIASTVMYESVFLSIIGIPAGIAAGLLIAFAGVRIANHFLSELSSLTQLMINELVIVIDFVISWKAILAALVISFLTILLSAWLPARKAAKITAIDSIRGTGDVRVEAKQMRVNPLIEKIFGLEGTLAAKNIKRSKRNLRASIISLTVGVVLFICLASISGQLGKMVDYINSFNNMDVMVDYVSSYDFSVNKTTGKDQYIYTAPIDCETTEYITEKLREFKGSSIFGAGGDLKTYTAVVPNKMITPQMREAVFSAEEEANLEIEAEIIVVDRINYASLCKLAGVPAGSNILV